MKRKRPREIEDSSDEEDEDPGLNESRSGGTSVVSQQDQEASSGVIKTLLGSAWCFVDQVKIICNAITKSTTENFVEQIKVWWSSKFHRSGLCSMWSQMFPARTTFYLVWVKDGMLRGILKLLRSILVKLQNTLQLKIISLEILLPQPRSRHNLHNKL